MKRRHPRSPFLVAALAVCAAACSKPKLSHTFALTSSPKTVEIRVSVNGRVQGPYRVLAPDAVTPVDLGVFEQPPVISAQALLPCGWSEVPVQHVGGTESEQRYMGQVLKETPLLSVWVDNRGGGHTKAGLGQLELPIAAGFTGSFQVPAPACEAGTKLRLGEAELTVVRADLPPKARQELPAYLIDASGSRCYRTRAVNYGLPGVILKAGPADERLRPARLHMLFANVDFFLQPAPEKIKTKFGAGAWKHELTELACSPRAT
jgi:hypothetical protein